MARELEIAIVGYGIAGIAAAIQLRRLGHHITHFDDVELSQYVVGQVVLIGDAAHSMSPQLGNGAQLAMEDAAMLATALGQHEDLSTALHAYVLARSPQLRRRIAIHLQPHSA